MVLAATSGFVLISVAVTYLLSVYAALARMTALAFEIHRFVGRDEGLVAVDVLVTVAEAEAASELSDWLASTASSLAEVVQADDEYPLLHYFHFPDERALPVALSDLPEVVTLCRTLLLPGAFPALTGGLVIAGTERVARSYSMALIRKFEGRPVDGGRLARSRRTAFETAWSALSKRECRSGLGRRRGRCTSVSAGRGTKPVPGRGLGLGIPPLRTQSIPRERKPGVNRHENVGVGAPALRLLGLRRGPPSTGLRACRLERTPWTVLPPVIALLLLSGVFVRLSSLPRADG
ncbi:hypothetical protein GCM10008955_36390 [Deinococcus malanensis]|uniref:Uncharacterized protein n=2 Tax=Deinococcus malanensis TaxID=1706855 RepID=A0ABQ2F3W1_9DEIO|nr:hypothetical protein GCM10008955_36390 [Deinococcus malanensis]